MSSMRSPASRCALAGARSTASARCGRPIGLPSAMRCSISRFVELEADARAGASRHAQRALLAVGEELGRGASSARAACGRCRSRGCAVRAASGGAVVDGGDLDGRDDPHAEALAGVDRLGDAADRVVVGQREQLDAGVGGAGDDLRRRQRRRRSAVECDCRSKRGATAGAAYAIGSGAGGPIPDRPPARWTWPAPFDQPLRRRARQLVFAWDREQPCDTPFDAVAQAAHGGVIARAPSRTARGRRRRARRARRAPLGLAAREHASIHRTSR